MRRYENDDEVLRDGLKWIISGVADIYPWLHFLNRKLDDILTSQEQLDERSARIEAANTVIAQEVADLKAQVAAGTPAPELDFSRLDAAIAGEEASEPAPVSTVDPSATPLDNAAAGISVSPAAGDPSVSAAPDEVATTDNVVS